MRQSASGPEYGWDRHQGGSGFGGTGCERHGVDDASGRLASKAADRGEGWVVIRR